jgi:hypothetical protein
MRKFLILLLIILPCYTLRAQNTTNSPTSMFGIGEIAYGEGGQAAGLGGAGIGLRNGASFNYLNPAGITALDSARFVFDMGARGAYRIYRQTGTNEHSIVGNLTNMGLAFRMKPYLYGGIFLTPISSCGYAVTLSQDVYGSQTGNTESSLFEGNGGISKAGLNIGVIPLKNLSLGASVSYMSGTITQTETQSTASVEIKSRKQGIAMDFGAQYYYRLDKHRSVIIGAVFAPAMPFHQHNDLTASSSSGGTTVEKKVHFDKQYVPQYYGIGVNYMMERWSFMADYRYYDWSKTETNLSYLKIRNQNNIMLGAQYIAGNIYRYPMKVMMGAGLSNSYIEVNNKKAENYYVSGGINLVFRGGNNMSIGVKYNDQFNSAKNMQRERGISVFLNVSFLERIWHSKIQ